VTVAVRSTSEAGQCLGRCRARAGVAGRSRSSSTPVGTVDLVAIVAVPGACSMLRPLICSPGYGCGQFQK
jgi:hypothetical protein